MLLERINFRQNGQVDLKNTNIVDNLNDINSALTSIVGIRYAILLVIYESDFINDENIIRSITWHFTILVYKFEVYQNNGSFIVVCDIAEHCLFIYFKLITLIVDKC